MTLQDRVIAQTVKIAILRSKHDLLVRITDEFIVPGVELGMYEKLRRFLLDQSLLNGMEQDTNLVESKQLIKELAQNPYA